MIHLLNLFVIALHDLLVSQIVILCEVNLVNISHGSLTKSHLDSSLQEEDYCYAEENLRVHHALHYENERCQKHAQ